MSPPQHKPLPPRFADLKREIASSYPNFQERVTKAWGEVLEELEKYTGEIIAEGPNYIAQINFKDLQTLTSEQLEAIKRKGSIVIKDVVDDDQARAWKASLDEFVKVNPTAEGFPDDNKQFFQLYWTKAQVVARAHPNVLTASTWLNNLYHIRGNANLEGVDLSTPLSYADRFRMRQPGGNWDRHPPHIDGGSIERWEDPNFRAAYADILRGDWRQHDPYDLEVRLNARTSIYGRPNQATCFRTFQGWLAMTEISPGNGTLRVFPGVLLSNAYLILRPFFSPVDANVRESLDPKDWVYDISTSEFPGIFPADVGYAGPQPNTALHPHLKLDKTMTSIPTVKPGDMVFWHCDTVHSVEPEHAGTEDSAVMYIGAVPTTPNNVEYVRRQRDCFLQANRPPDYPQGKSEASFTGIGAQEDIVGKLSREAMCLPVQVA